jgi:diguanylate cyclase (GGDEF)-like protein
MAEAQRVSGGDLTRGCEVLILEPRLDRAELLALACEEATPEVVSYRHLARREDVFVALAERPALLLASADDAANFETLLRVFRLFPETSAIAITADGDPGWEARLIQEGVGDVVTEAEIDGLLLARRIRQVDSRAKLRNAESQFPLIDPVTGLLNRAGLLFLGDRKTSKARQKGRRIIVAAIEIDGWREVLMAHGALAADELLASAAEALQPLLSSKALGARVGPASFASVLTGAEPNAVRAEVAAANQRLRQRRGAGTPNASCRVGVAEGRQSDTLVELLNAAHSKCYEIVAFAAGT